MARVASAVCFLVAFTAHKGQRDDDVKRKRNRWIQKRQALRIKNSFSNKFFGKSVKNVVGTRSRSDFLKCCS